MRISAEANRMIAQHEEPFSIMSRILRDVDNHLHRRGVLASDERSFGDANSLRALQQHAFAAFMLYNRGAHDFVREDDADKNRMLDTLTSHEREEGAPARA